MKWKKRKSLVDLSLKLFFSLSLLCTGGVFHSHFPVRGAGHSADQGSDPPWCLWRHPLLYHTKVGETKWCKGTKHLLVLPQIFCDPFCSVFIYDFFTRCGKTQPLRSSSLCRLLGEASSLSPPTISFTITATGKHTKGKLFFWQMIQTVTADVW